MLSLLQYSLFCIQTTCTCIITKHTVTDVSQQWKILHNITSNRIMSSNNARISFTGYRSSCMTINSPTHQALKMLFTKSLTWLLSRPEHYKNQQCASCKNTMSNWKIVAPLIMSIISTHAIVRTTTALMASCQVNFGTMPPPHFLLQHGRLEKVFYQATWGCTAAEQQEQIGVRWT